MNRGFKLTGSFEIQRYSDRSWSITLPISSVDVTQLCCELSLLLYEEIERLSLLLEDGSKMLLSVSSDMSKVLELDTDQLSIQMDYRDLCYMHVYLLRWYRDSRAEVDHVDIQLDGTSRFGEDCMFVVSSCRQPASDAV